jgi:hypothetical protein
MEFPKNKRIKTQIGVIKTSSLSVLFVLLVIPELIVPQTNNIIALFSLFFSVCLATHFCRHGRSIDDKGGIAHHLCVCLFFFVVLS